MSAAYQHDGRWAQYAHAAWPDVAPLIETTWPDTSDPGQREVLNGLLTTIRSLDTQVADWRTQFTGALPIATFEQPAADDARVRDDGIREALDLAARTAEHGVQRAVNASIDDLDELLALRLAVRDALAASPSGSPLQNVMPWLWRWESKGQPLTERGREIGRELRLSRYAAPLY